jgi:hypothetical protein
MRLNFKASVISILMLLLVATGCGQAETKTASPAATPPKVSNKVVLTAKAGPVTLKGEQLDGYNFKDYHAESICGMTRWQDKLVVSEFNAYAKTQPILLRAFNLDTDKGSIAPATDVLHNGILSPATVKEDAYTKPSADAHGYLYFQTHKGFRSFKQVGVGPLDMTYGWAQLVIAEDGKTAYAVNKSLAAKGTLENGLFTYAKNINPAKVLPDFGVLMDAAVGRGSNNKLYVTGFLKNQTSANTGIGILNPDLTFVKLADSAPQEKSYDINRPPVLKGLAVTDKYIVAWKVPTKNTVGNLYIWDTDGHYLGQTGTDKVLGDGWKPMDATVWEHNTLVVAACKLTGQEQVQVGTGANVRTMDRDLWTCSLFLLHLS